MINERWKSNEIIELLSRRKAEREDDRETLCVREGERLRVERKTNTGNRNTEIFEKQYSIFLRFTCTVHFVRNKRCHRRAIRCMHGCAEWCMQASKRAGRRRGGLTHHKYFFFLSLRENFQCAVKYVLLVANVGAGSCWAPTPNTLKSQFEHVSKCTQCTECYFVAFVGRTSRLQCDVAWALQSLRLLIKINFL